MFDVVALGELLIDFTHSGYSPNGMFLFGQKVANVLSSLARYGLKTSFIATQAP